MRISWLAWLLLPLAFLACRKPESALRERPMGTVEVVVQDSVLPPEIDPSVKRAYEREAGLRLAKGLNLPLLVPGQSGSEAVLQVFVKSLKPSPYLGRGMGSTALYDMGVGALFGAFVGSGVIVYQFTSPQATAAGAAVGGLCGLVMGPGHHKANRQLQKELGYLPWAGGFRWVLLERPRRGPSLKLASGEWQALNPKPFLDPLSPEEATDPVRVRRSCLNAYADAILLHLLEQGVGVPNPPQKRRGP